MFSKSKKKDDNVFGAIYLKYQKKQKISYEEYVILLATNDEIWFSLNNTVYQVNHGIQSITSMFITEYDDSQKISERSENYTSIIDLLHNFKVNGKTIKELWDDIIF